MHHHQVAVHHPPYRSGCPRHSRTVTFGTTGFLPRSRPFRIFANASWLNWIECEFTALRYFALDGSDYPSHAAQEAAIAGYVRWANRRARPKQQFAIGSKIRRPDYLPNVA